MIAGSKFGNGYVQSLNASVAAASILAMEASEMITGKVSNQMIKTFLIVPQ